MRAYVPTLPAPRRLWVLARSLSKGLERIPAWIDCWAPFRSSDPIHAEAGLERPRATTVISRGYSRTIQVFSERPADLQHTFSQWLSSVARTGSEPFPDELKKAVEKLTDQVPWHFPLESYGRQFEFSSRNATGLLHFGHGRRSRVGGRAGSHLEPAGGRRSKTGWQ